MVRRYPLGLSDVGAATSTAGDHSTVRQRRIAAAGAATIADIIADWWVNYSGTGVGLRGGTWSWTRRQAHGLALHQHPAGAGRGSHRAG